MYERRHTIGRLLLRPGSYATRLPRHSRMHHCSERCLRGVLSACEEHGQTGLVSTAANRCGHLYCRMRRRRRVSSGSEVLWQLPAPMRPTGLSLSCDRTRCSCCFRCMVIKRMGSFKVSPE